MNILQNTKKLPIKKHFSHIAEFLLNNSVLCAGEYTLRFVEIEFYYYSPDHLDPFTHKDFLQQTNSFWYFHRMGKSYRGGSFKGLDITFGQEQIYGGILIRSLQNEKNEIIEGPSLCVDYLLGLTKNKNVAELADKVAAINVFDTKNNLHIKQAKQPEEKIQMTGRIGLSLKKKDNFTDRTKFILQPYRHCIFPTKLKKGKVYTILSMYQNNLPLKDIATLTNSNMQTVENYTNLFETGKTHNDFSSYSGTELTSKILASLHGTWHKLKL